VELRDRENQGLFGYRSAQKESGLKSRKKSYNWLLGVGVSKKEGSMKKEKERR